MAEHFGTPETHGEFFSVPFSTELVGAGMNPDSWLRLCCKRGVRYFLKRRNTMGAGRFSRGVRKERRAFTN